MRKIKKRCLGYLLNRKYWNQGYITEATRKVIAFGFEQLGLHRIIASCDPANIGSYRVMEKIGMQREGYLAGRENVQGVWRDFPAFTPSWKRNGSTIKMIPRTK